jgi:hypothetical protein
MISCADLLFSSVTAAVVFSIKVAEYGRFFKGANWHSVLTSNLNILISVSVVQILAF